MPSGNLSKANDLLGTPRVSDRHPSDTYGVSGAAYHDLSQMLDYWSPQDESAPGERDGDFVGRTGRRRQP